jgi:hypothetical protein
MVPVFRSLPLAVSMAQRECLLDPSAHSGRTFFIAFEQVHEQA